MGNPTTNAPNGAEQKFTTSHFDSVRSVTPREIAETWPQLIRRFSTPTIRASKSGPLLSAATFDPPRREKQNVKTGSLLVCDVDGGMTIADAETIIRALGVQAFIYTTHSHQRITDTHPQPIDCFRIVIALAEPIDAQTFPRLWQWENQQFDGRIDPACKDASRMYFPPIIASKDAPFVFRNYIGQPLNWRGLGLPDESQLTDFGVSDESPLDPPAGPVRPSGNYGARALDGECERVRSAPAGQRNNALNLAAYHLGQLGIDQAEVESVLTEAALKAGLDKREIKPTIRSGYKAGLKKPRIINSRGKTMKTSQQTQKKTTSNNNGANAQGAAQSKRQTTTGNGSGAQGAQGAKQKPPTGNASSGAQTAQGNQTGAQTKKASAPRYNTDPIEFVLKRAELFHDSDGRLYATIKRNGHAETHSIRGKNFALWWKGAFFQDAGKPLSSDTFTAAISVVEAMAQFRGAERRVHLRVAEHVGNIYVDLCDPSWRVVEITPDAWRVIESKDSPVLFTRRGGMLGLPEPVQGGELNELRPLANCQGKDNDDTWTLIASWLAMGFNPHGPYPILSVGGEQGSGKSTTSRMLQRIIDPNAGDLRGVPKEERDLMIAANNCWLMAYDNLSGVSQDISDRLCRLATGAGFGTRTLHTNDEETIFCARRPILVNGLSDITYSDYLDRNVSVYLHQIPDDKRRDEKIIWSEFDRSRPQILGALFSGVSHALKHQASVKLARKPRMADFAIWASATEEGLGLAKGAFTTAYEGNRAAAHEVALDTSPAVEIREFVEKMANPEWEGRSSDLLQALNTMLKNKDKEFDPQTKQYWPKGPNKLTEALRRMTPNFRAVGIEINCNRSKKGSKITIKRTK